jgi:hypothetical protein
MWLNTSTFSAAYCVFDPYKSGSGQTGYLASDEIGLGWRGGVKPYERNGGIMDRPHTYIGYLGYFIYVPLPEDYELDVLGNYYVHADIENHDTGVREKIPVAHCVEFSLKAAGEESVRHAMRIIEHRLGLVFLRASVRHSGDPAY